jgi:hypothetical protein
VKFAKTLLPHSPFGHCFFFTKYLEMVNNKPKKKKADKGPRTYDHGKDSRFVLSMLDQSGKWHSIFSRDRPGSRSRKVFTDDQLITHLKESFSSSAYKQFNIPNCVFAYIAENQPGNNYTKALHHHKDGQWRTGAGYISSTNIEDAKTVGKFMLCRLDQYGKWHKSYSKVSEEPDTVVMNQLAIDFNQSSEKATTVFAYIAANRLGHNHKNALCHWKNEWKQGKGEMPFLKQEVTFTQGKDSLYVMHVKTDGKWLPYFYSVDRANKHSPTLLPEADIIQSLKNQFQNGGYQGNYFDVSKVQEAYIMRVSDKKKVQYWYKNTDWVNEPISVPENETPPKLDTSRLWYRGTNGSTTVFRFNSDHTRQFELFREGIIQNYPQLVERYTDPETSEISDLFFEAFYWAYYAGMWNKGNVAARDARIYFGSSDNYLQVRFTPNGGQPYTSDLKAWPDNHFFMALKVPKQIQQHG